MSRTVGKLADRLLSLVAPKATAAAGYVEYSCNQCDQYRRQMWHRWCTVDGCGPWYGGGCGSC